MPDDAARQQPDQPVAPPPGADLQDVVDRLVAQVYAGAQPDPDDVRRFTQLVEVADLCEEVFHLVWRSWLPTWDHDAREALGNEDDAGDWQALREICDGDRIAALVAGEADPADEELLYVARRFVVTSEQDMDMADVFPGLWSGSASSQDGCEVWFTVMVSGYSFGGLDYELLGPFTTPEELGSARLAAGFLSPDEVTPVDVASMRATSAG